MHHLAPLVQQLSGKRVLVIGDIMIDEYLRGDVSRISPEAPVPVLEVRSQELRLGGAANTAANIAALGGTAMLAGVVGRDEPARAVTAQLSQHKVAAFLSADPSRPTTKKTRLVAQGQQIVRLDYEKRHPLTDGAATALRENIEKAFTVGVDAVVLSDYAKGVLTLEIVQHAIAAGRAAGVPVVVDPKQRDLSYYRGATVITPNLSELEKAVPGGMQSHAEEHIAQAAAKLLPELGGASLLVTRSADGMSLYETDAKPVHIPALATEVFDVTGAGDTVVAVFALALGARIAMRDAIELASIAAAISVSKRGTATVKVQELIDRLHLLPSQRS